MLSAIRLLARHRGFAFGVIGTLSLGIAAATLVFAVLHAVVLRPLPYLDPDRLALLWTDDVKRAIHEEGVGLPTVQDWRAMAKSFEDFAVAGRGYTAVLSDQSEPERVEAGVVSANLWSVLGVPPAIGRAFTREEDERSARVAVISHALWMSRFGGSRDVLGKTIELSGKPYAVIGVMRESFHFPSRHVQAWIPLPADKAWSYLRTAREADYFKVVGRLRAGVSMDAARREMDEIGRQLAARYPSADPEFGGFGVSVQPFARQYTGDQLPRALWLLMGAVGFVLAVACANAAGLMAANTAARSREFALRAALGAGLRPLLRQQAGEALTLAAAAALLGGALAAGGLRILIAVAGTVVPRLGEARLDWRVIAFAAVAGLVSALVCGPLAAWRVLRADPADALRRGGRGVTAGRWTQTALAAAQSGLAVVLITGAALMVRSLIAVSRVDAGYDTEHTVMLRVDREWGRSGQNQREFWTALLARLNALPGVRAGAVSSLFIANNPDYTITPEGRPYVNNEQITGDIVTPSFFEAAGVRVLAGRTLTELDLSSSMPPRLAVINRTMAARIWPGENAVGKRLQFGPYRADRPWTTVVGVVDDMRRLGVERRSVCEAFGVGYRARMDLVVRGTGSADALIPQVRRAIREVDPAAPVYGVTTLAARLQEEMLPRRLQTALFVAFAGLTLLVASVGLYAAMRHLANDRLREFAIRMAVGARQTDVFRSMVWRGVGVAAAGCACGMLAAVWVTRWMESLLYEVRPADPWAFAWAPAVLLAPALLACVAPAVRSGRVDPARLLNE